MEEMTVLEAVNYVRDNTPSMPVRPKKPLPPVNGTAREHLEYSKTLVYYELELETWRLKIEFHKKAVDELNEQLVEHIKDQSGLYITVPKQYQDKLWWKAWQYSHSDGYYEVYLKLCDLIEIFE